MEDHPCGWEPIRPATFVISCEMKRVTFGPIIGENHDTLQLERSRLGCRTAQGGRGASAPERSRSRDLPRAHRSGIRPHFYGAPRVRGLGLYVPAQVAPASSDLRRGPMGAVRAPQ